jgi:hypothetical protein
MSGAASPFSAQTVASPILGPSPVGSPRAQSETTVAAEGVPSTSNENGFKSSAAAVDSNVATEDGIVPSTAGVKRTKGDDEYVVLTEQGPPIAAPNTRERSSTGEFCDNLSRIAHVLEQLALQRKGQFPSDALALLIRALGLLEKALNLSLAEEVVCHPLRKAFLRILDIAQSLASQMKRESSAQQHMESVVSPCPNRSIFQFAVSCIDAAMKLSHADGMGGQATECYKKLTLASLLLDLLGSEAEGEDASTIAEFTVPLTRLIDETARIQADADKAVGKDNLRNEMRAPCLSQHDCMAPSAAQRAGL